jgi:hypothetical protein
MRLCICHLLTGEYDFPKQLDLKTNSLSCDTFNLSDYILTPPTLGAEPPFLAAFRIHREQRSQQQPCSLCPKCLLISNF